MRKEDNGSDSSFDSRSDGKAREEIFYQPIVPDCPPSVPLHPKSMYIRHLHVMPFEFSFPSHLRQQLLEGFLVLREMSDEADLLSREKERRNVYDGLGAETRHRAPYEYPDKIAFGRTRRWNTESGL